MTMKDSITRELDSLKRLVERETKVLDIFRNTRKREVVDARCLFYMYAFEKLKIGPSRLGAYSNQDHSTVSIALKRFSQLIAYDVFFIRNWKAINDSDLIRNKFDIFEEIITSTPISEEGMLDALKQFKQIVTDKYNKLNTITV